MGIEKRVHCVFGTFVLVVLKTVAAVETKK